MTIAFVLVASLLLTGYLLRQSLAFFRWLYIPASVIGGMIGLIIIQIALPTENSADQQSMAEQSATVETPLEIWAQTTSEILSGWPGWLIAIVFAGMLLESKSSLGKETARRVGRQGLMVWIIVLGQTAVGLLATWLLIQPFYDVPNSIGMLIETGFAGGHGTAAAMGEVFAHPSINLPSGKDLGMLMATCGLVSGIVTGIAWINLGVRKGWVTKRETTPQSIRSTVAEETGSTSTIDPMVLQVIWLALAFGIGLAMQAIVMHIAGILDGPPIETSVEITEKANQQLSKRLSVSNVVDFPIFIYTLFGGLIVRKIVTAFGQAKHIDGKSINRLTAAAMDILVVAAITSLNLQAVVALIVPFSVLFVCGSIWAAVCLLLLARWILPSKHWFELGLINYGMSTGTTATGFVLLRMVDPELQSGAAEDYALAAPISAPFVGGGIITIALPLLLLERVHIAIPTLVIAAIVSVLVLIGRSWRSAQVDN